MSENQLSSLSPHNRSRPMHGLRRWLPALGDVFYPGPGHLTPHHLSHSGLIFKPLLAGGLDLALGCGLPAPALNLPWWFVPPEYLLLKRVKLGPARWLRWLESHVPNAEVANDSHMGQ